MTDFTPATKAAANGSEALERAKKLAYQRGYSRGRDFSKWPEHVPPIPPDEHVSNFYRTARQLRDGIVNLLSGLTEDDEWVEEMDPKIEAFDAELTKLSRWLRDPQNAKADL